MNVSEQMPSSELAKIIFFIIIQIAMCFLAGWGVIPAVILLIGYFLSKRDKNISLLIKAIKASQVYVYLTFILIFLIWGLVLVQSGLDEATKGIVPTLVFIVAGITYLITLNFYFKNPLEKYPSWIEQKRLSPLVKSKDDVNILRIESPKNFSSADELLKWKELKDQGLISEDEFIKMKEKIMGNKP